MKRRVHWLIPLVLLPGLVLPACSKSEKSAPATTEEAEGQEHDKGESAKPASPTAAAEATPPPMQGFRGRGDGGDVSGGWANKEREDLPQVDGVPVKPGDMYFEHYGVNPTIDTAEQPRSTFAADVDNASYTMARAYLERGQLPVEAAVRVEEIVNAFDYGYEAPTSDVFAVHAEAAPSPNRKGYHVLHIGVKGKEVKRAARKAANLTFVVDVSGSMDSDNRIGLVKRSLGLLVDQLGEADKVGIVVYGSTARAVLEPTSAHDKQRILRAIDGLRTEGATNAEAGIRLGYQMATRTFKEGGVNRVILCSDGVANVGMTGPDGLLDMIGRESNRGITISSIGFGMGNYNDVLMEKLANKGNGNYYYVDKLDEARRVFVDQLTGTLEVIAKDVKIQVDFDKSVVARYRLIGYENRALQAQDFDNDRVDAGEIGAGHAVTALYEVKLREGASGSLGTLRIRYKQPTGSESSLVEKKLSREVVRASTDELSSPTQLSLAAAQFAEKLRGSYWARNVSYEDITRRIDKLSMRERTDVSELKQLVQRARQLDQRGDKFESQHGPIARMDFDRVPVLR
ncbi:MAG TPA: VWA domain-containing protein [Polyangiaceae bacterium]|jgi:Ca-activated chloride channel family protein|nr:VWA domain-containing protein [Polyangiaceae bacterium]